MNKQKKKARGPFLVVEVTKGTRNRCLKEASRWGKSEPSIERRRYTLGAWIRSLIDAEFARLDALRSVGLSEPEPPSTADLCGVETLPH